MTRIHVVTALGLLALCGCGSDPGERAVSGGAIGAGAGVAGAAILGAPLAAGAAVGAVGGAVYGAATTPDHPRQDAYDKGYRDGARDEDYGR